jgi:hypothetical protein
MTVRALLLGLVAFLCWCAAAAAEPIRGLAPRQLVVAVPHQDMELVGTDAAGDILASTYPQYGYVAFDAAGNELGRWDQARGDFAAIAPDGTVYTAPIDGGNTVTAYDLEANPLRSWPAVEGIQGLVVDPRGSLLLGTFENNTHPRTSGFVRFSFTGENLGRVPGFSDIEGTAVAPNGVRWQAYDSNVIGVLPSGRLFQRLAVEAVPPFLSATPDGWLVAGNPGTNHIRVYDKDGRLRFDCHRHFRTVISDSGGTGVLIGIGNSIYRAAFTASPVRPCKPPRLTLTGVRVRHERDGTDRVTYNLSRPASVQLTLHHLVRRPCHSAPADPFDPSGHTCVREALPTTIDTTAHAGRNAHRYRTRHGLWYLQLSAADRAGDAASVPFVRVGR